LQDIITTPSAVTPIHHKEWVTIFIAIAWNILLARKVFDNITLLPDIWKIVAGVY
jgi:hypothetical protein